MTRFNRPFLSPLIIASILVLLVLPQSLHPLPAQDTPTEPTVATFDQLLEEITLPNCEKAIAGYKTLLQANPNSYEILYKLANTYIHIIELKTSALLVEKDEYKPLLKDLGKTANDYAKKAHQLNPNGKEAIAAELLSYGYYSASFGIVKAIFKGAAGTYKDLANTLIKLDDKYLDALGYRALGKLYHAAPWPVGSSSKALKFFRKATQTYYNSLYSHYYVGVLLFKDDQYNQAEKEFKFVISASPSPSEKHIIQAYKDSAQNYLKKIAKERD